jgi:hypothetical protein
MVWIFLIIGYCSVISSGLLAVYVFDKSFQSLKVKRDVFAILALVVSSIVVIGITTFIINLFG